MLNKEEIEFNLKALSSVMLNFEDRLCDEMQERVQEVRKYINQLESREQKLIEKLEEDIREETGYAKWVDSNTKRISSAVTTMISKRKYAQEILEILK